VIDGVTYEIDLSQPSRFGPKGEAMNPMAQRIDNLCYDGQPVDDAMEFVVATNHFRAAGGGGFPGADGTTTIMETPETVRDVLIRYVVEKGTVDPTADGNGRLKPMKDTTVLYDTGPGAEAYKHLITDVCIERAGDAPGGFARFRIFL